MIAKNSFSFPDAKKMIVTFLFVLACTGYFQQGYGQETTNSKSTESEVNVPEIYIPEISEIIPLASEIKVKLLRTHKVLSDTIDKTALVSSFNSIDEKLDTLEVTLNKIKAAERTSFNALKIFKREVLTVAQNFKDANIPLSNEIAKIEGQRKMWLKEQENWLLWEDTLVTKNTPTQIITTFKKTNSVIDTALNRLVPKLGELLILQENSYKIQPKIDVLLDEHKSLSKQETEQVLIDKSASMLSSKYKDQFTPELWKNTRKGFVGFSLKNYDYPTTHFWGILLGIFLFLTVYLNMKKNNEVIQNTPKYKFLANKAFSSAVFVSVTTVFLLFKYETIPPVEEFLIAVIVGASLCYVLKDRLTSWKKQIVYFFVLLVILDNLFFSIDLPTTLFRLYIALFSLSLILLGIYWIKISRAENDRNIWIYSLFAAIIYFGIIFLAEIIGKEVLALYLYDSFIRTAILLALYGVYLFIIHGALERILLRSSVTNKNLSPEKLSTNVERLTTFIKILAIVFIILPQILITWGVYSSLPEATDNLMAMGFKIGDSELTLQLAITSVCILYGSYIISSLFSRFIMNETLDKKNFDKGTRLSIAQLVHYFIMFVGFVVAISVLGFNTTNFTIALSALGVGIGFGLQGLVNNFVSGLILLFERPIREGDSIEAPGVPWSTVKEIGLRSTRLITYERGDLIVPNSELIYKNVTNWTLTNKIRKIILPIGVVYGSDIALVVKTLMEAGKASDKLVKNSEPTVLLRKFDESSLNFELRVLAKDATSGLSLKSTLLTDITERFNKANIEFAFPQVDVHLYKMNQDRQKERFKPKTTDN